MPVDTNSKTSLPKYNHLAVNNNNNLTVNNNNTLTVNNNTNNNLRSNSNNKNVRSNTNNNSLITNINEIYFALCPFSIKTSNKIKNIFTLNLEKSINLYHIKIDNQIVGELSTMISPLSSQ